MESLPRTQLVGCFGRLQLQKVRVLFYFLWSEGEKRVNRNAGMGKWMDGREKKQRKKKRLLKLFIIIGGNYGRVGG